MNKKNLAWDWYWKNLSNKAPVTMLTDPPRYPPDPIDAFIAGYEAGHSAGCEGCLKAQTEVAESDRWDNDQRVELDLMAKEYANKEKVPSDEFPGFQIMAIERAYKDGYRARQLHEKQEFATSYSHGSEVQKIAAEYVRKRGTAENLAPYEENRFIDGYLFALKQLELKQS